MFRSGSHKIVKLNDEKWELYDIINDPTEIENLAESFPNKVKELSDYYNKINNKLNNKEYAP
jgi:arylsulfatase